MSKITWNSEAGHILKPVFDRKVKVAQEVVMAAMAPIGEHRKIAGFKHILVATDFSPASERALAYALPIARACGAVLSILHAVPPEPRGPITWDPLPRELDRHLLSAEKEMAELSERNCIKDLHPDFILEHGRACEVLASVIQDSDIDLLVLGTHGRGGLNKLALGSVAEEALRLAPCPVLTVGPNVPPPASDCIEFKSILFATDFGPASAKALPYALSLAEAHRARLVLLHMVPPMPVATTGVIAYCPAPFAAQEFADWQVLNLKESARRLRALIPPDANLAYPPEYRVSLELLPEGVLGTADASLADLIVMGANHTPSARVTSHIPWALTHAVICGATCPVLTVRD